MRKKKGLSKSGKILVSIIAVLLIAAAAIAFIIFRDTPDSSNDIAQSESMEVGSGTLAPAEVTITFTGDCIFGRDKQAGYDGSFDKKYDETDSTYFFKNFQELFSSDDITVVDFEGTLTESNDYVEKEFNFKGPAKYTDVLVKGNVEMATLANNHTHDYGSQGFSDTKKALEDAGIKTFGYDDIAYVDIKGVKVAFIGTYAFGADGVEREMVSSIKTARNNGADVVIVYAHWGEEKEYTPNYYQVGLGHAAIDAGADLVLGTHPHVLQGYEKYKGHYIVYSLGNFCFGGNRHPYDMDCYVLQWSFEITNGGIVLGDITIIPVQVSSQTEYNDYQPIILEGSDRDRVLKKVEDSNSRIASM